MTPSPFPQPGPPARSLKVLYAEDLRELRQLAEMMLSPLGHRLECCSDGLLAWERVRLAPDEFDLIITDHHMPEMNGLELVARLRTLPFRGRILVFSSDLDPRTAIQYRALEVDRILNKPVEPRIFWQVIAELFPPATDKAAPTGAAAGTAPAPPPSGP